MMIVVLCFFALEVVLMLSFRFWAHKLWHIHVVPDEPCWLDVDRAVHELRLSKDVTPPVFRDTSLDDLDQWLLKLGKKLSAVAHESEA